MVIMQLSNLPKQISDCFEDEAQAIIADPSRPTHFLLWSACSFQEHIQYFDLTTKQVVQFFPKFLNDNVTEVKFAVGNPGKFLVVQNKKLTIFDVNTGNAVTQLVAPRAKDIWSAHLYSNMLVISLHGDGFEYVMLDIST